MSLLLVGIALFVGVHSAAVVGLREPAVARVGEGAWKVLYSVIALAGLVAMTWGYGQARSAPTVLWIPPVGFRHLAVALTLPVFPLFFAAYLPGRIRSAAKHPMLAGTKLWAFAHLLANGMLADVLLFGSLLAWAVVVRLSLGRRAPRALPTAPAGPLNDALAVGLGGLTWALTVGWAHARFIGVPPVSW